MKILTRLGMAAVAAVLSMTLMSPAQATRPIPGYPYPDVCTNIKGVQPIYVVIGVGPYDFDETTPYEYDCVKVYRK